MISVRKLADLGRNVFHSGASTTYWLILSLAYMALAFGSTPLSASENVHVLTAGGIDEIPQITVETPSDQTPIIGSASSTPLKLDAGGPATYTDITVLAGGHLLLADGAGRGAVLFDDQGQQVDELFGAGGIAAPPSTVAAGYVTPNKPDLFLMGDNSTGRVQVYDAIDETYIKTHTVVRGGETGDIARAIAMPGDQVGVAVNWSAFSLAAVQVMILGETVGAATTHILTLLSEPHPDFEESAVIDGLFPVRDVAADLDGRLLITSRDSIVVVDSGGELLWRFDIGDDVEIGGQFQSARWLDSGLIVAATREPGRWNEPHTNHRVHLFDPDDADDADAPRVDTSPSFGAAPLRLEPAQSQGGTGTRGYFADAFSFDGPSPSSLTVDEGPALDPEEIPTASSAGLSFSMVNDTDESISIRRAQFRIASTGCEDLSSPNDLSTPWWSDSNRDTLVAGETWRVDAAELSTDDFAPGPRCGQLALLGRDGTLHFVGETLDFEITAPDGQDGPVTVEELAEFDSTDAGGSQFDGPDQSGCACSSASSQAGLPVFVLALILLISTGLRRQRSVAQSPR